MCFEALAGAAAGINPITLAISLGGLAFSQYQQQKAADRAEDAALEQMQVQQGYQDRAFDALTQHAQGYDTSARQESIEDYATQLGDQYAADMLDESKMPVPISGKAAAGNVSDAYTEYLATQEAATLADATEIARLMGAVEAPGYLLEDEGLGAMSLSNTLTENARQAGAEASAGQYDVQAAGQVDPWLQGLGGLMYGAGLAGLYSAPPKLPVPEHYLEGMAT